MCKLFCVLDVENKLETEKFIRRAVPYVTKTDNHGLGLMRLGENGVHIQRWLDIPKRLETSTNVISPYKKMLRLESNEYGKRSNSLQAIALHGRLATCGISLENTHPFYMGGSALMHNGIISNPQPSEQILSSCDSESLLHRYVDFEVKEHPSNLTDSLKGLNGYYGVIVFNDNGVIDIWRDDQATLFLAYVRGIGTVIATTTELIYRTAKVSRKRVEFCYPVQSYSHLRWERGKTPKILEFSKLATDSMLTKEIADLDSRSHWWNESYDPKEWKNQGRLQYLDSQKGV